MSRRDLHGVLLLDKPTGITSNTALQIAKRLYKAKKAGHSGSLDPLASGLLPICFGEATKFSRFLLESDKHYQVTAKLGVRTDTCDSEGKVINVRPTRPYSLSELDELLERFRGNILQVPSMYSAIKHQGQPLYKLARQGIVIERDARAISIYELTILSYEGDTLSLEIRASKGTYVRNIVDDIGEALECGAHVIELRRLGAGSYTADQMITFETLEYTLAQEGPEALDNYLLPVDSAVSSMPDLILSDAAAYYLKQGQAVIVPYAPTAGWVRLSLPGNRFLGIGEILEDGKVAPRRLTQEIVSF